MTDAGHREAARKPAGGALAVHAEAEDLIRIGRLRPRQQIRKWIAPSSLMPGAACLSALRKSMSRLDLRTDARGVMGRIASAWLF